MAMNAFYMGNTTGKRHGQPFVTKVDKNGSKHYTDNNCSKCGGTGYIPGYEFIDGARCWQCNATGFHPHHWVERTPEYQAKLDARRVEKLKKQVPEHNAKFLEKYNFSQDGKTYVVLGKTFNIKEELKLMGAKFDNVRGWHFNEFVGGVELKMFTSEELLSVDTLGRIYNFADDAHEKVKAAQVAYESKNTPETNYFGNVGEKVELRLNAIHSFLVEGYYGSSYINKLVDSEGNIFIWKTGRSLQGEVVLKGTIKEHNEYRGEKQTVLTRCKEAEITA